MKRTATFRICMWETDRCRERETGRTPFKCYSSVTGQKDRGLLSTAGDEKQAHVCFMSTCCSVCVGVGLIQHRGEHSGPAVRGPHFTRHKTSYYYIYCCSWREKTPCCIYHVLTFPTHHAHFHLSVLSHIFITQLKCSPTLFDYILKEYNMFGWMIYDNMMHVWSYM